MKVLDCYGVCCDRCVEDSYELIDRLVKDIQLLASEVVRLRYSVSWFLPEHMGDMIRCEIRSDLYASYYHDRIYQDYMSTYYGGDDPLQSKKFCNHLAKLAKGKKSIDEFPSLTF